MMRAMKFVVGQVIELPGGGQGEVIEISSKTVTVRILPGESHGIYPKEQLGRGQEAGPEKEVS